MCLPLEWRPLEHDAGSALAPGATLRMLDDVMEKIEKIEQLVQALSSEELAQFRTWFLEFDWAAWDRQLEADVRAGRLDALAEQALQDHATGKTKPL